MPPFDDTALSVASAAGKDRKASRRRLNQLCIGVVAVAAVAASTSRAEAQLTWSLAGGSESWPAWARDAVTRSMNEAVATYNQHGHFARHLTANYNAGVPTAQASYSGWIDFGGSTNTRVAFHEIAHALGTGTAIPMSGGPWREDGAAGRLAKLYDGRAAVLSTGGSHFWPYGLNYDNEDGPAARERLCKLVGAFRFDAAIVVDSDKDGLPDDWEQHHFGALTESGQGDVDADGITNLDEYATDSDPRQACPVVDGRAYVIRSQITKRAVAVAGASEAEGAATEQREPNGTPSQQWTAHYVGGGFWRFRNVRSGKVLEVPGMDTASGRPIRQAEENAGALQQEWRIVAGPGADPNYFQIASRQTGRVVDGLDGAEGAPIQQWPFLGNLPQQFWTFEEQTWGGGDAGAASDGGIPMGGLDAGVAPDAGSALPGAADAGGQDAGQVVDASTDASTDTGTPTGLGPWSQDPGEGDTGGCALNSGKSAASGLTALLAALALVLRRRRRPIAG